MPVLNPNAETEWPNCQNGVNTDRVVALNVNVDGYSYLDGNVYVFGTLTPEQVVKKSPVQLSDNLLATFAVHAPQTTSQVWSEALVFARSVCPL
tara:strand:+ start:1986 stop:2267 length:282 start_codon:yes stop_codon:yes gene_type:complete